MSKTGIMGITALRSKPSEKASTFCQIPQGELYPVNFLTWKAPEQGTGDTEDQPVPIFPHNSQSTKHPLFPDLASNCS